MSHEIVVILIAQRVDKTGLACLTLVCKFFNSIIFNRFGIINADIRGGNLTS